MVDGTKVATPAPATNELVKLRRSIGYAVQGSVLFPHLSVAQNIGYVPKISGASKKKLKQILNEPSRSRVSIRNCWTECLPNYLVDKLSELG